MGIGSAPFESTIGKLRWVSGQTGLLRQWLMREDGILPRGAGGASGVGKAGRVLVQGHCQVKILLGGRDENTGPGALRPEAAPPQG